MTEFAFPRREFPASLARGGETYTMIIGRASHQANNGTKKRVESGDSLYFNERTVSKEHAKVSMTVSASGKPTCVLQDLNSHHGTIWNDKLVPQGASVNLNDGDRIGLVNTTSLKYMNGVDVDYDSSQFWLELPKSNSRVLVQFHVTDSGVVFERVDPRSKQFGGGDIDTSRAEELKERVREIIDVDDSYLNPKLRAFYGPSSSSSSFSSDEEEGFLEEGVDATTATAAATVSDEGNGYSDVFDDECDKVPAEDSDVEIATLESSDSKSLADDKQPSRDSVKRSFDESESECETDKFEIVKGWAQIQDVKVPYKKMKFDEEVLSEEDEVLSENAIEQKGESDFENDDDDDIDEEEYTKNARGCAEIRDVDHCQKFGLDDDIFNQEDDSEGEFEALSHIESDDQESVDDDDGIKERDVYLDECETDDDLFYPHIQLQAGDQTSTDEKTHWCASREEDFSNYEEEGYVFDDDDDDDADDQDDDLDDDQDEQKDVHKELEESRGEEKKTRMIESRLAAGLAGAFVGAGLTFSMLAAVGSTL